MMKSRWRIALALTAAGLLAMAAGAAWWRGRAARALLAAEQALDAGDPASAIEWLRAADSDPDAAIRPKALLLKARAAVEMGRPGKSVEALNAIDPEGPFAAEAAFWKGRALLAVGQSLQSLKWLRLSSERDPDNPETLRWLAVAAYDQGAVPLAIDSLETVTRLRPDDARAWRTLGMIHKEYRRFEQAIPAYKTSLELDPKQPAVRLEYAECLVARGVSDEAVAQLDACAGGVDEAGRSFLMASALRGKGDHDKFASLVRERSERFPDHDGLMGLRGVLELQDGHPEQALKWLDRAVSVDPWNPEHYSRRSLVRARLGDAAASAEDSRKSVELNDAIRRLTELDEQATKRPEDARLRCQLGQLCASIGKFGMAASWYRAALACDPSNAEARWGLHNLPAR